MDPGLRDLLDYKTLTAAYDAQDLPLDTWFTDRYYKNPQEVETDSFEILFYPKMRRPAPANHPGAEARVITTGKAIERKGTLISAFNVVDLPAEIFKALREPDSYELQKMGRTSLMRILAETAMRHKIMREVACSQIVNFGRVNIGAGGDFLTPTVNATSGAITDASGTEMSCDFGVSNNNRGNLNGLLSGLWSDPNTKIGDQIDLILNNAEKQGTKRPTKIKCHSLNKRYLRLNYQFQDWAFANNKVQDTVLQGEIIPGLWGLDWEFYGGKYEVDQNGTTADYIPQSQVCIHPDDGPWIHASAGLTPVPKEIGITQDIDEAVNNMASMYGPFSYVAVCNNPPKLQIYMGDLFGINFPDPRPIYMPTVFPAAQSGTV